MKNAKSIVFAIAVFAGSQAALSEESGKLEVHPTAWTQLDLKGDDKNLAGKIAAQITANPKNVAALVEALIAANPDHAEAITVAAIVTLDASFAAAITRAAVSASPVSAAAITKAAVSASPGSAVAITKAAVNAAPNLVADIAAAAVSAAPSQMEKITTAAVAAAPQQAGQIVKEVVGLAVIAPPTVVPHSESSTNNASIQLNTIVSALENKLNSCPDNQCRISAADAAVKLLQTNPALTGAISGDNETLTAKDPNQPDKKLNIIENKNPASPS